MEKYPPITESITCFLQVFIVIILLLVNFLVSFGMSSFPKLSKYVTFTYNAIQ